MNEVDAIEAEHRRQADRVMRVTTWMNNQTWITRTAGKVTITEPANTPRSRTPLPWGLGQ